MVEREGVEPSLITEISMPLALHKGWGGWTRTSNLRGNNPMRLPVTPHPNRKMRNRGLVCGQTVLLVDALEANPSG